MGSLVAASEITNPRVKRSCPARTAIASAAMTLFGLHVAAWADTTIGTTNPIFVNLEGAICTAVGTPAAGTNTWACQVPNTSGGFATISGIASNAAGNGPDIATVSAFVAANLGTNAILIGGTSTKATGNNGIAIAGQAVGDDSVAIGRGASAFGNHSIALGESAIAGKNGAPQVASSIAIGEIAKATGDNSIAIGRNTSAGGNQTISIGIQAGLNSQNSDFALFVGASAGTGSNGKGNTAIGFGSGQSVVGEANTALGATAGQNVIGDTNTALGRRAGRNIGATGAPVNSTVAVGYEATATVSNGVALGSGSLASTVAGAAGYVPSSASVAQAAAIATTQSTMAAVSVGNVAVGNFRQINGVAAGTVDSDAVNVSQLKAVSSAAAASATHYFGVNDGGVQGGNYANDGATGVNSLAAGVAATALGAGGVAVGNQAQAIQAGSVAAGSGSVASGGKATALGNAATASGSNSVALGANSNDAGRSNVVSVGTAGAERQISNVAPGTQMNDAVNLNQLNSGLERATTQLRNELIGVSKDANAGSATAIAMANMPQAFTPGKSMIAAGVGSYGGQTAISIGVSKLFDKGRWVVKFSGSADTRGSAGVGGGVGFQW